MSEKNQANNLQRPEILVTPILAQISRYECLLLLIVTVIINSTEQVFVNQKPCCSSAATVDFYVLLFWNELFLSAT